MGMDNAWANWNFCKSESMEFSTFFQDSGTTNQWICVFEHINLILQDIILTILTQFMQILCPGLYQDAGIQILWAALGFSKWIYMYTWPIQACFTNDQWTFWAECKESLNKIWSNWALAPWSYLDSEEVFARLPPYY